MCQASGVPVLQRGERHEDVFIWPVIPATIPTRGETSCKRLSESRRVIIHRVGSSRWFKLE